MQRDASYVPLYHPLPRNLIEVISLRHRETHLLSWIFDVSKASDPSPRLAVIDFVIPRWEKSEVLCICLDHFELQTSNEYIFILLPGLCLRKRVHPLPLGWPLGSKHRPGSLNAWSDLPDRLGRQDEGHESLDVLFNVEVQVLSSCSFSRLYVCRLLYPPQAVPR